MKKFFLLIFISFFSICIANAGSVISTFVQSSGTLVEGFENSADWTVLNGSTIANENTYKEYQQGSKAVSISMLAGTTQEKITKDLGSVNDFSTVKNFPIALNFSAIDSLTSLTMELSSVSDFSKGFTYTLNIYDAYWIYNYGVHPRWQNLLFRQADFVNSGSDSWTTVRYLRFTVNKSAGTAVKITFDNLRKDYSLTKCKVIMTFDDGLSGQYANAFPIMEANGQKGVAFVVKSTLLTGSYMTIPQALDLYNHGWDVSQHGGAQLSSMDAGTLESVVNGDYDWLISQGFLRSAKFYAYPSGDYGAYDYTITQKVAEKHVFSRTTIPNPANSYGNPSAGQIAPEFGENDPYRDERQFLLVEYQFNPTSTPPSKVLADIDRFIENKSLVVMLFHEISNSPFGNYEYSTTGFQTISNYLKTKSDSGDLDVITFTDLYNSFNQTTSLNNLNLNGITINQ